MLILTFNLFVETIFEILKINPQIMEVIVGSSSYQNHCVEKKFKHRFFVSCKTITIKAEVLFSHYVLTMLFST